MTVLNGLVKWLASKLDGLKIKSPVLFVIVQSGLILLNGLFIGDKINLPTPEFLVNVLTFIGLNSTDGIVIALLSGLIAAIGPRTTAILSGETDKDAV